MAKKPAETVYLCRKAYSPHQCQYYKAADPNQVTQMSDCKWQGDNPIASKGQNGLCCLNEKAWTLARKVTLPVQKSMTPPCRGRGL